MPLLLILAASCLVSAMTMRVIDPVVPDVARDLGVGVESVALLASAFTFPYAFCQPLLGSLGDALGKARIIKICLTIVLVCLLAGAFAPNLEALFVIRMIGGAAGGGIIPLAFALVGDRFPFEQRQIASASTGQVPPKANPAKPSPHTYAPHRMRRISPSRGSFVVVGVGFYMIHNSLQTQATELAPDARGAAVAAHAFFFFLGQAAGPIVYGLALPNLGAVPTLLAAGAIMAVLGAATARGLSMLEAREMPSAVL